MFSSKCPGCGMGIPLIGILVMDLRGEKSSRGMRLVRVVGRGNSDVLFSRHGLTSGQLSEGGVPCGVCNALRRFPGMAHELRERLLKIRIMLVD